MKKQLVFFLIWFIFLEIFFRLPFIDHTFFPSPLVVFKNTLLLLNNNQLIFHLSSSLFRLVIAFIFSLPLALILSLLCAHFKLIDQILNPVIAFSFPLPKVAIYPLLLLLLGIDNYSKVALIAVGIFYLLFINFRIGFLRLRNSQLMDIIKIYPVTRFHYFFYFLMKGSLQEILTGLKLALNYGLTLVVVSELTASNNGIGYFIWKSWDQFKVIDVYSGVLTLSIIGFVLYYFFNKIIERTSRYY